MASTSKELLDFSDSSSKPSVLGNYRRSLSLCSAFCLRSGDQRSQIYAFFFVDFFFSESLLVSNKDCKTQREEKKRAVDQKRNPLTAVVPTSQGLDISY